MTTTAKAYADMQTFGQLACASGMDPPDAMKAVAKEHRRFVPTIRHKLRVLEPVENLSDLQITPPGHLHNQGPRDDSLHTTHAFLIVAPLPALAPLRHPGLLSAHYAKRTLSHLNVSPAGQTGRKITY